MNKLSEILKHDKELQNKILDALNEGWLERQGDSEDGEPTFRLKGLKFIPK